MAETNGGPRIWNRGDLRTMLGFADVYMSPADEKRLFGLMEWAEGLHKRPAPAQPRDDGGRFVSTRPRLEAMK